MDMRLFQSSVPVISCHLKGHFLRRSPNAKKNMREEGVCLGGQEEDMLEGEKGCVLEIGRETGRESLDLLRIQTT